MEIDQKQDGGDHPGHWICENDGVNIVVAWYVKKQPQYTEGTVASHGKNIGNQESPIPFKEPE